MSIITNKSVLVWLNSLSIRNKTIDKIMKQVPELTDLWYSSSDAIYSLNDINTEIKDRLINYRNEDYLKRLFYNFEKQNIDVVTVFDKNYPDRLHYICDSPKVLYVKGSLTEDDNLSIAIVGSRKTTSYGKWATEKFAEELVDLGVTIVSGLALGIDAIAHRKALEKKGRTIGVLGNGIDIVYPNTNKALFEEIPKNGAIISEFFLGTPPLSYNFPQRNRIISGLSLGVIVIEAKEKSGSLITAHHALEQGKEVFALPGNINSIFSKGTNKLIKDGAKLIMDIEDVVEEIHELQEKLSNKRRVELDYDQFSSSEVKVLETMKEGPIHADNIAVNTGIDISTINSILTILELKGVIKEIGGSIFTLST
ncbi:DNA-processing protein DprA [Tepidimicrobium xylanilyticum]|uniref:DNA processing protein n=1 Tax=Tepidimicrobium xylanilyticum TaxID=1123352 RepID=A0A1H2YKD3_9FIRM|nr:DNA-processing protein DprA [Tepidimicrobium xylanilyticum]GMG97152.1 DNA processing protein DprA [Tepidimicrobium xylanilyticum]SDX04999.1 DNA processing protein [Tepidimicrobium xylanilyticum]